MTETIWKNRIVDQGMKPASEFKANPKNWRRHPKDQSAAVRGSLDEIGWIATITVNRQTGFMIDGHERLAQAIAADPNTMVPYIEVDLTPEEEALALTILDPITGMATVDKDKLDELLREIDTGEDALQSLLTDLAKDNGLYFGEEPPEDVDPKVDQAEELRDKWGVEDGQLWQLGNHRLACGDSTDPAVAALVMGDEKADLVFTDPPYGISYKGAVTGKSWDMLKNDDLRGDALQQFLADAFKNMYTHTNDNTALYCWHASITQRQFENALNESGYEVKQQLVWNKGMSLGRSDYHWAHELVFYCKKAGQTTPWYGDRTGKTILGKRRMDLVKIPKETLIKIILNILDESTVWEIDKDLTEYKHSTQKPTTLAARAISNNSMVGQIVIDFFLGSGSTLIACEGLNRKCRAIEYSPNYVAVAIQRWVDVTGGEPKLL